MKPFSKNDVKHLRDLNFDLVNYFANTIIPQMFVDADMILRIFTPPAMKQFSLSQKDINRNFHEVKDNIRYPTIIENIEEVIGSNEILEKEIQTENGKWFQMNILPYKEHQTGKINGVIITFIDITSRLAALRELERLNAKHNVLMFALSHDLRQPLTSISLLQEGLKQSFKAENEEQFNHWIESLKIATGNINSLIDGFTTDAIVPPPEQNAKRVNIQEITNNVLDALRDEIQENGVNIITNYQTSEILFPKNNLRSIVYNLIHNAFKFRDKSKSPIIRISTFKEDEFVVLIVEDNGIGISNEDQKLIFKKSARIHHNIDGTGLGLYIIKRMLNIHGGRVEVESQLGKGSSFKIFFKKHKQREGSE